MGRPLKIKKSTTKDIGFNSFANLDVATQAIPTGMTTSEFLGVVGGSNTNVATSSYPVVAITANVNGQNGAAHIITQKGQIKYLVAGEDSVTAGSFTPGFSYQILTLGTTNWTAIGAGVNPQVGQVFTATGVGSGTGTASDAGQCILTANSSISSGQMNMTFNVNGNTVYASRLTNKYIFDSSNNRYAVNFFVAGESVGVPLANVAIADTAGNITCNVANVTVGQIVTVSGSFANASGTISGYANPTNYYVLATSNGNAITLGTGYGSANIVTTAGNTTGVTFTLAASTTAKSGADAVTWSGNNAYLTLAQVSSYTS
jgi:hypothetical protein